MSVRLLRPLLGQLLVVGFTGDRLPVELRALAREFDLGGVLLGPDNCVDAPQVADLAREAQSLSRELPVWVGRLPATRVAIPPFQAWPPLVTLARADDETLTRAVAGHYARQQLSLGLSLDFLPVLDLPGRSAAGSPDGLSSDPDVTARHGAVIVDALQSAGLAACGRHFPGIGEAATAAGLDLPLIELPPDHLAAVTWQPFMAAIAAGVSALLVSHVFVPSLDEQAAAPQSRHIVHDVLRQQLGFTGVIVADDLDPHLPGSRDVNAHLAVQTLRAGCDVLVQASGDIDKVALTLEQIIRAAERDDPTAVRLENALRRHELMKAACLSNAARRGRPPVPTLAEMMTSGEQERLTARMLEFS